MVPYFDMKEAEEMMEQDTVYSIEETLDRQNRETEGERRLSEMRHQQLLNQLEMERKQNQEQHQQLLQQMREERAEYRQQQERLLKQMQEEKEEYQTSVGQMQKEFSQLVEGLISREKVQKQLQEENEKHRLEIQLLRQQKQQQQEEIEQLTLQLKQRESQAQATTVIHPLPPEALVKPLIQNTQKICFYCNGKHFSANCQKIPSLMQRKQKAHGHCYNCLNPNHRANECNSPKTCLYCRKRHHSSLCPSQ